MFLDAGIVLLLVSLVVALEPFSATAEKGDFAGLSIPAGEVGYSLLEQAPPSLEFNTCAAQDRPTRAVSPLHQQCCLRNCGCINCSEHGILFVGFHPPLRSASLLGSTVLFRLRPFQNQRFTPLAKSFNAAGRPDLTRRLAPGAVSSERAAS
jgi:hypothetical protein